jgi:hypothetical protein
VVIQTVRSMEVHHWKIQKRQIGNIKKYKIATKCRKEKSYLLSGAQCWLINHMTSCALRTSEIQKGERYWYPPCIRSIYTMMWYVQHSNGCLQKQTIPNCMLPSSHIKTLAPNHTRNIKQLYLILVFCMHLWMSQIHHHQLSTKHQVKGVKERETGTENV